MRKICYSLILAFVFFHVSLADSIEKTPVGPGVMYYHEYRQAGPWHLYVLEINLKNEWLHLQTAKSNNLLAGYERTSSMSSRNDREGHRVVGAVNGDFYESGGIPTNAQVIEGVLMKLPISREVFGCSDIKEPFIAVTTYNGKAFAKNDSALSINNVNVERGANQLIAYNKYYAARTLTNYDGAEITVDYLSEPIVNDTMIVVVTKKDSLAEAGHGNAVIPTNGFVLSGNGIAKDYLNSNFFVGDTVKVIFKLPAIAMRVKELIGGNPTIIKNGVQAVPSGSFSSDRHPRTAVGFSQDSTKLYLVVVDGRQVGFSIGMSLYELADYMLEWDIHQAVNLDGGGSTTMVVRKKVVNSPSDTGGERSVANSLLLVSTAPTGPLNYLRISPKKVYIPVGNSCQFSVTGFDQYYNSVSVNSDSLMWTCDSTIGSIDSMGKFQSDTVKIAGFIYVNCGEVLDTAQVFLTGLAEIKLQPNPIILKIGEQQTITAEAKDNYGNIVQIPASNYTWEVAGNVGTINSTGVFTATTIGEGVISATFEEVTGTTPVSVGAAANVMIDDFTTIANWSITGTKVNIAQCKIVVSDSIKISEPSSGRLDYSLATGGTTNLNLNCTIPISGTPDAISIQVYGDGKCHWLRGEFIDKQGEKFLMDLTSATPGIDWTDSWKKLEIPFSAAIPSWANPLAVLDYPVTWKRIYLAETDDAKKDVGTLYFDDFSVHFIETETVAEPKNCVAGKFRLESNYPNPFNNQTNFCICADRSGDLKVMFYDLSGKEVDRVDQFIETSGYRLISWKPENLSTGLYLYKMQLNGESIVGKCLFVK